MIAAPDKFQARIAKYQLIRAFRREHQHLHMSKMPSFTSGELGASSRCWHILTQCKLWPRAAPQLESFSQNAPSSWQALLEARTRKVCCLLGLAGTSPRSQFFQWTWHLCHTLGCLLVQSWSPAFSLASLTSAGNIYEGIRFWWHMQILICEHNYLLCMHKTDSLAHSVGIT